MVTRTDTDAEPSLPGSPPVVPWHALEEEDLFGKLSSSFRGFTNQEAALRFADYGPNALPVQEGPGIGTIFLHQFKKNTLIYILLAAALISVLIGDAKDALEQRMGSDGGILKRYGAPLHRPGAHP